MAATLNRTAFVTDRALEYFTEKHLTQQIGCEVSQWPLALLKELLDNALDAAESEGVAPDIIVTIEADALTVEDNGPGLPENTIENSLDYTVRVSDKSSYVSPSRGQLGNALKCIWAAPFVADASSGCIEVQTGDLHHTITVTLDRIEQRPLLEHKVEKMPFVKNGTILKMHYPQIACLLTQAERYVFYKWKNARPLLEEYAALNPHASFTLTANGETHVWERSNPDWTKWIPSSPTSPHWYDADRLRTLIASYVTHDKATGRDRTVRELVSEFAGLSGTAKQKSVTQKANVGGSHLRDLVVDNDIGLSYVESLLEVMKSESRSVKPSALGVLGEAHLREYMEKFQGVEIGSIFKYKKFEDDEDGIPIVIEVAFGLLADSSARRRLIVSLNHTPALVSPLPSLEAFLADSRIDSFDPVCVVVHITCPRMNFVDTGKTSLRLTDAQSNALGKCIKFVTTKWTAAKRQVDKDNRVSERDLNLLRKSSAPQTLEYKEAAYMVMEESYLRVSDNGKYPANARQIMYEARPRVLKLTGGKVWKDSGYFTQKILSSFINDYPELTEGWDVVFDARGKFIEPHTGRRVDLGTLAVRRYRSGWHGGGVGDSSINLSVDFPTSGPSNRYRYVLFVEKEGFNELLDAADIAGRYDIAIMSTKGMSVTASRQLVQELSDGGVTVFVLRDFDKSGFSIVNTLRSNTTRFQFRNTPRVIDLGMRLEDVQLMQLESESVEYGRDKDPCENLLESGATDAECAFLVTGRDYSGTWIGERVELNAMTSPQFIKWIESKLEKQGVKKVVPDAETLKAAYRRAWQRAELQKIIDSETKRIAAASANLVVPSDLEETLARDIEGESMPWDVALYNRLRASN